MPERSITLPEIDRDGTSQADRLLPALNPDSVSVDERSLKDLLCFAREYGKELRYFNEKNEASGDWSAFIGDDIDLDQLLAFIQNPAAVAEERRDQFSRPHLTLFLSFLKLLQQAQKQMNTLTQRHLDFYYQDVLRMQKKAGVADQVNILLLPQKQVAQHLLPAGTSLSAGPDASGKDRLYETNDDLVVSQAQVACLKTVYSEKEITGIREARESKKGTRQERFVQMLGISLGHPLPGDPLPLNQILNPTDAVVDFDLLTVLGELTAYSEVGLFMPLFDLRSLMKFKRRRDNADEEWAEINAYLEIAARKKRGNATFVFNPADPRNFDANLIAALEGAPDYRGITEVSHIDHVYTQRNRTEVQDFIRDKLYFDTLEDFLAMMRLKLKIDKEWEGINQLLETAGRRKRNKPSYRLSPTRPTDFTANMKRAIAQPFSPALLGRFQNIDVYYEAIEQVERNFYMSAESFNYFISAGSKENTSTWECQKIDEILLEAHRQKVYAARRATLKKTRETQGMIAMLHFALSEDPKSAESNPLSRLKVFLKKEADAVFLDQVSSTEKSDSVSESEWAQVYKTVEMAQRFSEGFQPPTPTKEAWINLYPAPDATQVMSSAADDDEGHSRWLTFGQANKTDDMDNPPDAVFGWGISSPLFAMAEGVRVITLTLGFDPDTFFIEKLAPLFPVVKAGKKNPQSPFQLEISTEKGWIVPDRLEMKLGRYASLSQTTDLKLQALQLKLYFSEAVDPIRAYAEAQPQSPWPALRLGLRQSWDKNRKRFVTPYAPLKDLRLSKTHVSVSVAGLSSLYLENDQNALNAKKPFEPFTRAPAVGSRLYIGHPELLQKQLDTMAFEVEWMAAPKDLADHYKAYGLGDNFSFKTGLSLIDRRVKRTLAQVKLFENMSAADAPQTLQIPTAAQVAEGETLEGLLFSDSGFIYEADRTGSFEGEVSDWSRYFQWELQSPDFQHSIYAGLAGEKALALSAAISNKTGTEKITASDYQVNPPYTPKIKKISVSYTSTIEVDLAISGNSHDAQIYHLHPFGHSELSSASGGGGAFFLPQYQNEGELYIGIKALQPPQSLSLLFQMAEGSADPDLPPGTVSWHFLSGNRWLNLQDGNLLSDSTRGLINSGIVRFLLAPKLPNTQLPEDLYWIRASMPQQTRSVCDTVAIHAQAVSARRVDAHKANDLSQALAAESITDLALPRPEIKAVFQPYTSFGGKAPEATDIFYTRVSEGLRHKQRAITFWDYEHLVLEHFPEIYKVKCLPANLASQLKDPGRINIIVIPEIQNKRPFNPFEPKAPADLIADIEAYLSDKHPPSAKITVKNAFYIAIKVRFGVRFKAGIDARFYKQHINTELNRFLSPWAYEEGSDIVIGGKIYANSIINFLDQRPYVDYVVELKLFSSENGIDFKLALPVGDEGYFVTTDRSDGVLVAAQQHEIDLISDAGYEENVFSGLNYMKVELDFIVG